jgi:hypothetical protein
MTQDLLLANNFHFENNCAVLAIVGALLLAAYVNRRPVA